MGEEADVRVNGLAYWNTRFEKDWVANAGQLQSRFFSAIALHLMPPWLVEWLRQPGRTICDWGCAMGDGTDALQKALGAKQIVGIDFAPAAIEQARAAYPDLSFEARDLLATTDGPIFDVIFSSNTLEHFEHPWSVSETLSRYARDALLFLVPFQEDAATRHEEHFYSFDWSNVQRNVGSRFSLVDVAAVDAGSFDNPQWGGRQILLVYLSDDARTRLADTLQASGGGLLGRIAALDGENLALRARARADRALRVELEDARAVSDSYESQLIAWKQRGEELLAELGHAYATRDDYEAQLVAWRRRGEELRLELEQAYATRDSYEAQLLAWRRRGEELRIELEQAYETRDSYEVQLLAWRAQATTLESQVKDLETRLAQESAAHTRAIQHVQSELGEERARYAASSRALSDVLASRSWRMTAWLRAMSALAHRLLGRV